ncbi:von Willebrand factor type A domain-containing protein [uncultured Helicobacter sp.]|uniref:vWA domain-containing protein n=1 Tax=uncultured Helicobacter sp. TaxID=175537 RepID=UPI00374F7F3E
MMTTQRIRTWVGKCLVFGLLAFIGVGLVGCDNGRNTQQEQSTQNSTIDTPKPIQEDVREYAVYEKAESLPQGVVSNIGPIPKRAMQNFNTNATNDFRSAQMKATPHNTDSFDFIKENGFKAALDSPLSTFGADVDSASYALVRYAIERGYIPNPGAVRIEELLNSFEYDYKAPKDKPLAIYADMSDALWNPQHKILRIGIQAQKIDWEHRPASNLIFLIDTSGSMMGEERIGLVQKSLNMLVSKLDTRDTVGIVTYAGNAGILLEPTNDKEKILSAIEQLSANGSTHGSAGIEAAYTLAQQSFIKGGVNRIILATDGDFNVGISSPDMLLKRIKEEAKSGVYLSVFGFGMGNYKDSMLVKLADNGNGNYGYIDSELEAKRQFVQRINANLITIAKDVKIQVEFNPAKVYAYRLIGYEKRALANEDFNNDSVDSGDVGVGHSVSALYEIIPVGVEDSKDLYAREERAATDSLKYSQNVLKEGNTDEWATIKVRYKKPENQAHNNEKSTLLQRIVTNADYTTKGVPDMRFAQSVAAFGMLLSNSPFKGKANFESILSVLGDSEVSNNVDRQEFLGLVAKASKIQASQ